MKKQSIQASDLTIIIPLDFNRRGFDLLYRVKIFINTLKNTSFKVIFGVNNQPHFYFNIFKKMLSYAPNFSYESEQCKNSQLSKLRNLALKQVKTTHVLFLDIDIFPEVKNLYHVINDLNQMQNSLVMYPCLYLSKKGNKAFFKHDSNYMVQAYYDYRRDLVKHLAFPSSIIACDLKTVNEINGFDEDFIGYAYEDLDFMIRLFHKKNLIQYTPELLIDEPYLAPMMSVGFRAILAETQLEQVLKRHYFVHLFHKKDSKQPYYKAKSRNKDIFKTKLLQKIEQKNEPTINNYRLIQYIPSFKNQKIDYSVLWAEIKGHKFR